MFTGIIKEVGIVASIHRSGVRHQIEVKADEITGSINRGDSIAVSGICLTVVNYDSSSFSADVMPETLRNSSLGELKKGDRVNLEPALGTEDLFDGHLVTGHIDGTGSIKNITREKNARIVEVNYPRDLQKYLVEKGSIALNGVSLTLADLNKEYFTVSLIPETWRATSFHAMNAGRSVNLEADIIGKYVVKTVENYLHSDEKNGTEYSGDKNGLTRDILRENNFL